MFRFGQMESSPPAGLQGGPLNAFCLRLLFVSVGIGRVCGRVNKSQWFDLGVFLPPAPTEGIIPPMSVSRLRFYNPDREAFEDLVDQALADLPDQIQNWLDNVAIVVAERPTPEHLAQAGIPPGSLLFGLYVGVPKTQRGFTYGEIVPDKILIFRQPILQVCRTPAQVRAQVRQTVLHEIGHHFGLDEEQLRAAGV